MKKSKRAEGYSQGTPISGLKNTLADLVNRSKVRGCSNCGRQTSFLEIC